MMPEEAPGFRPRHARDPLRLIDMRAMLHREMSAYQDIAVVETREVGRALFLDGVVQSTDHDEARYHAHLIHPVRELVSKRRRVLVAGAGEGASLRELVSDSEIESIVAVEIDRRVVEVCREYFPHWHAGAYDDARVDLRFADIRRLLPRLEPQGFDLIVVDLTDPVDEAPDHTLIDARCLADFARCLEPSGVMVMQFGELHHTLAASTARRAALLRQAFAHVAFGRMPIYGFNATWGLAFASQRPLPAFGPGFRARVAARSTRRIQSHQGDATLPFRIRLQSPWARSVGLT